MDLGETENMVIASRKSPSMKQWAASILSFTICAWILSTGISYYREWKSMERGLDLLATECAKRGGCTLDARFDY
jgi:hypothetical protein